MAYDPRYERAHRLYAELRRLSFDLALERSSALGLATPATRITPIDRAALRAYERSWTVHRHWTGEGGWPWDLLVKRYLKKPRAFHAALWEGDELCGLAVGAVSRGKQQITLHYMESSPKRDHPLRRRVRTLLFEAVLAYGRFLRTGNVFLRNPLPGALPLYLESGFEIAGKRKGLLYLRRTLIAARSDGYDTA